jgi:hypothetical protein
MNAREGWLDPAGIGVKKPWPVAVKKDPTRAQIRNFRILVGFYNVAISEKQMI